MAIITISQILNRAGLQENLPQLAGGELGWCFDTQKLYVGNGTTADGSPAIGNTEILTQHSNVLELANNYDFKNQHSGYVPSTGSGTGSFRAVGFGLGKHVAVGADGLLATSTDAVVWTPVVTNVNTDLNGVVAGIVYQNVSNTPTAFSGMIAVGDGGTILVSTSGTSWAVVNTSFNLNLKAVAYASGKFVAVTDTGYTAVSSDGYAWSLVNTGVSAPLNSITFGGGRWVVAGVNGKSAYSTDLVSWTVNSVVSVAGTAVNFDSVAYKGFFVATAGGRMFVSPNGASWAPTFVDAIRATAYGLLNYVAVGDSGLIWTSSNSSSWTSQEVAAYNLQRIAFASSMFVAVGDHGTIHTSTDAINWVVRTTGTISDLYGIVHNGTVWIVVGSGGTVITSADGVTWTARTSGTANDLEDVAMFGSTAVAVGRNGTVIKSTDGTTWTSSATGVATNLWGVSSNGTTIVAVGDSGTVLTSTGTTWTLQTIGTTATLYSVTTNGTTFTAVGQAGTILTSADAITWTSATSGTASSLLGVDYVNNSYVAVGNNDTITRTSSTTWTVVQGVSSAATPPQFHCIAPTPTGEDILFVAVGENGRAAITRDGVSWTSVQTGLIESLNGVEIVSGMLIVAVGTASQIATSPDGDVWTAYSISASQSVTSRPVQDKFDDFVSVKDYGAVGNGTTDDAEAINRALRDLYCTSTSAAARKILWFPAGVYAIGSLIKIPSNAKIRGEGAFNSTIKVIHNPSTTGIYYLASLADNLQQYGAQLGLNGATMPFDISLTDIGLSAKAHGLLAQSASRVVLERVALTGSYVSPEDDLDPQWNLSTNGLEVIGTALAPGYGITLRDCYVEKFSNGVKSDKVNSDVQKVSVTSSVFKNLYRGVDLVPVSGSATSVTVANNHFDAVFAEGIRVGAATDVVSSFNLFGDVGNGLGGNLNPITSVISFGANSVGCSSISDTIGRAGAVTGNAKSVLWEPAKKMKLGTFFVQNGNTATFAGGTTTAIHTFSNTQVSGVVIDYAAKRGSDVRTGTMILSCNAAGTIVTDDRAAQTAAVGVTVSGTYSSGNVTVNVTTTSGVSTDFSYAVKYFSNVV